MKFNYRCNNGTKIFTEKGRKSENDFKIITAFPKQPWAHSLEYIGRCLRLKAKVEEINYPDGRGKHMLLHFCQECILKIDQPIIEICKKFGIKSKEEPK